MTRDDDFIGSLEAYLDEYEGMTPLPDAVRDAVRAQLPMTKQLGRLGGPMRRFPVMNENIVRFGIAAAAVVLVVVLGINYLSGPRVGNGPEPTVAGTPSPTAEIPVLRRTVEFPGRYFIFGGGVAYDWFGLDITATVPAGWSRANALRGEFGISSGAPSVRLSFWLVDNLMADNSLLCGHSPTTEFDSPVGSSVAALAAALATHPAVDATSPRDVSLAGWSGMRIDLRIRDDHACDFVELWTWYRPSGESFSMTGSPGESHEIWILDVDGLRLVIDASSPAGARQNLQSELREIVDSIDIEPRR